MLTQTKTTSHMTPKTTTPCSSTSRSSFFFQAEDGIRDYKVTGVQTCALPISGVVQPDPVGVTVPVPATAGLLVALHGHAAERYLDLDGGFREGEGEGDVQ